MRSEFELDAISQSLRVSDENARIWYMNEAAKEGWSSRTLDRNISTIIL